AGAFLAKAAAIGLHVAGSSRVQFTGGARPSDNVWSEVFGQVPGRFNGFFQQPIASSYLPLVHQVNPDFVYLAGELAPVLMNLRRAGYSGKFAAADAFLDQPFIDSIGSAAEGMFITSATLDVT